jgi:CRISPR-associated endonuclease/helicase Cas3
MMHQSLQAWGKTDRDGGRHHLAHHCADVAAVLESLLRQQAIRSRLSEASGQVLTEQTASRIVAWAFLHDAGKLAPAFQAKGWPAGLRTSATGNHLEEAGPWFGAKLGDRGFRFRLEEIGGWYQALLAHHGRPWTPLDRPLTWWGDPLPHYDWTAAEAQLLEALDLWFPDRGGALPAAPRLHHLFAGLLALADWIGSDRRWFDFVPEFDPAYGDEARRRAAQAVADLGLDVSAWRPRAVAGFAELTGHGQARPAQAAVDATPGEERLVILEAETGSGKTEAALWRFARLLAEGRVEGIYFALPTRAAAGQIQDRTREVLGRWLRDASPGAVLAVPGLLRVDEEEGRRLPGWEVAWESDGHGRHWAAEHATRFLAAPVAVGTVDQAMMAALSVKHAPMRAAALSRSLLVVDEVHASDAYMRGILRRLLDDHLALGGHAMLMSATLGSVARSLWLGHRAQPPLPEAEAVPYPAVWTRNGLIPVAPEGGKDVALETVGTMEPGRAAALAMQAARAGARVLVVRNTVTAAVATWKAAVAEAPDLVLQVAGGPALHHARFAAEDRRRLDAAVEAALGKGSPGRPVIAVGTQTLEQALDIDADLLVTDLCPVDVLLQRLGRLHRHARSRPQGCESARALVLLPEGGLGRLAEPRFENGLGAWLDRDGTVNGIYIDLAGLEATRRLIEGEPLWRIPAMNRRLVEAATHPDALAAVVAELEWESYDRRVTGKRLSEARLGQLAAYSKDRPFHDAFQPFADDGAVRTRLGGEGAVLTLPPGAEGPFGGEITRLALPAHWSKGLKGDEVPELRTEGEALVLTLPDQTFLYGRGGLRRDRESR